MLCFFLDLLLFFISDQASGQNAAEAGKAAKFFADLSWKFAQKQQHKAVSSPQATNIGSIAVSPESLGPKARRYHREVSEFVHEEILPIEQELRDHTLSEDWKPSEKIEQLKQKAKEGFQNN